MRVSILLFLSFCYYQVSSQFRSPVFFDEMLVSMNKTDLRGENVINHNGFGLTLNAVLAPEKRSNWIIGIEYNKLKLFRYNSSTSFDVTYRIHNLSMPITYRFGMGDNFKYFIEPGLFFDWNIKGIKEGYTLYTGQPNYYQQTTTKIGYNFGVLTSSGFEIPLLKHAVILKADYKLGTPIIYFFNEEVQARFYKFSLGYRYKVSKKNYHGL